MEEEMDGGLNCAHFKFVFICCLGLRENECVAVELDQYFLPSETRPKSAPEGN